MRPMPTGAVAAMTGLALLMLTPPVAAAAASPAADTATEPAATGGVVVNEFAPSDASWPPIDEFVELRNTSDQPVSLDGWELVACLSPHTWQVAMWFGFGDEIPPSGYLLLAHRDWAGGFGPTPDRYYDVEVPEDGGWLLYDPWSGYADGVGLRSGLACTEGSPAPQCEWADGEGATRDEAGEDTDDNAADFTCQARTPGR